MIPATVMRSLGSTTKILSSRSRQPFESAPTFPEIVGDLSQDEFTSCSLQPTAQLVLLTSSIQHPLSTFKALPVNQSNYTQSADEYLVQTAANLAVDQRGGLGNDRVKQHANARLRQKTCAS